MLQELARNGTAAQKEMALRNLTFGEQVREDRQNLGGVAAMDLTEATTAKERIVYDAQNGSGLPGTPVRGEGDPATGDLAVDEAYDGAGATYDLYFAVYGRNSINNSGMRMDSTVHYQIGYDNAFWNGSQMVYGDGDEDLPESQRLFNRFTIAIDVIGHELTHGVTQFEANLTYRNQPGALNESMSDVFGSLVKQRVLNQTARQADWIIGEGLFTSNVNGVGIRSMRAPGTAYNDPVLGKDPQPGHMDDYVNTTSDNGGVHINSGIPNRAFYLIAYELDGYAWEKAGRIWYETLTNHLTSSSDFQAAADATYLVAGSLYGVDSPEQIAVKNGWAGVGITVGNGGGTTPTEPPGCLPTLKAFFGFK
ncbi:MAG: M4 family metallopeptidase [Ardenticatenaceae bacterium]|nr:M4 family metallopeptidase [Ardenticatenaceae bacterium]